MYIDSSYKQCNQTNNFVRVGYNTKVLAEPSLAIQIGKMVQTCPKMGSIFKTSFIVLYFQSLHAFTHMLACKKL
jgi:hypothetical protein